MIKSHSPRLFRFFTISIIGVLSLLLNKITTISIENIQLPKNKPEYNIINPSINIYNNKGIMLYNINSKKAWQYPNSESMFLQHTSAFIYESNSRNIKYQLNSNLAWLNYNKQIAYLIESSSLIIWNDNNPINIYGSNILINIESKLISSKSKIKAVTNQNLLMSEGFTYDNKLDLLILESNVKIIYNTKDGQETK